MGAGPHRNPVARDVEAELGARAGDARKAGPHRGRIEVRQIEIHVRVPRPFHLRHDRPADDVARGQLAARVVVGHEAMAVPIDQHGPFAAHGLGDQAAAAAGDVQHGGMELHELHVAQLGPRPIGDRQPVAGGHLGIGRFAIDLPAAAGAQNGLLGPDQDFAVLGVPHQRPAAATFVRQQIDREGVFPGFDVRQGARAIDHGPHHFLAGRVAQGVDDAVVAVAPFAPSASAPASWSKCVPQSISSLIRVGRLADDHFDDRAIAQLAARRERVGDVIFKPIFRIDHAGDAALGVVAVRLPHRCSW